MNKQSQDEHTRSMMFCILSPDGATIVDEALADIGRNADNPMERIADDQSPTLLHRIMSSDPEYGPAPRLVYLECGHFTRTRASLRCDCPRCGAMVRAGYDRESFRRHEIPDTFDWPADPLRSLHEPSSAKK